MLAGFQKLTNLVCIYDYNHSQVDGPTYEILSVDPVIEKMAVVHWAVREIDGHDMAQILDALSWAVEYKDGPALIVAKTIKGKGFALWKIRRYGTAKAPNKEQAEQALKELMQEELS